MRNKKDKIIASLVIIAVFIGITGFSIYKSMTEEPEKTSNSQTKQIKSNEPKADKGNIVSNKKKLNKPKAIAKKSAVNVARGSAPKVSFDIKKLGSGKLKNGVYYGIGHGFGGDIKVKVTVSNNKISAIEIVSHNETQSPINYFVNGAAVIDRIISAQSPNVDKITNATWTSNGIKTAVYNAIRDAYESENPQVKSPAPVPLKPNITPLPKPNKPDNLDKPDNPSPQTPDANPTEKIFRGDVIFSGTDYDYDVILEVNIKDGKVVSVIDKGTLADAEKSKFASLNVGFWTSFIEANGLGRFEGKTEGEIESVDAVTNATATTNGAKEAILKAFEAYKKTFENNSKANEPAEEMTNIIHESEAPENSARTLQEKLKEE